MWKHRGMEVWSSEGAVDVRGDIPCATLFSEGARVDVLGVGAVDARMTCCVSLCMRYPVGGGRRWTCRRLCVLYCSVS